MNVSKANYCKFLYYCGGRVTYNDLMNVLMWYFGSFGRATTHYATLR